jgi:hypothetical protein
MEGAEKVKAWPATVTAVELMGAAAASEGWKEVGVKVVGPAAVAWAAVETEGGVRALVGSEAGAVVAVRRVAPLVSWEG